MESKRNAIFFTHLKELENKNEEAGLTTCFLKLMDIDLEKREINVLTGKTIK